MGIHMDREIEIVEWVVKFVLGFIGVVVSHLLRGWVVVQYWAWFIQPTFGLPPLTVPVGLGISTLLGYVTMQWGLAKDKDYSTSAALTGSIVAALFILGFGWLLTQFMKG